MLFVALGKQKPTSQTPQEGIARRAQWKYPEGIRVLGEYWTVGGEYDLVVVMEADNIGPVMAAQMAWADAFEFHTAPAVTAEEGIRLGQMMTQR